MHRECHTQQSNSCFLECECGKHVEVIGESVRCKCGRVLGSVNDVVTVGLPTEYWGEIPQSKMRELLEASRSVGWREALGRVLPPHEHSRIADVSRVAFRKILPIKPGSRVLDIGRAWESSLQNWRNNIE